ncbi:VWA domain-containing protein [Flavobacteriaceae bacterium TP-CH-4]|uniref:VWA domain-containing protein n=1 Tax=Pelagihabitans pacificus TaxID=2696054 RepID=A0A967EE96_9FLAO|nr:VWA domain-containing protein [Pelagihabitans pacificus]NHF60153.1 VWA domain-containing protein [Pelagihabitans pacificus]
MDTRTVLLIILSAVVAVGLVLFQYRNRSKKMGRLGLMLSFLRFLAWFGAFLLLINPKFAKNTYAIEKPNLLVLADNSTSTREANIPSVMQAIKENSGLSEKYNLHYHSFGKTLNVHDSLDFQEKNTNIAQALKAARTIYGETNNAVVLVTDGNQTLGEDYEFYVKGQETPIYPLVVGDTTRYEDVRVGQLNVNKYAFLNNKYPLEVFVNYEGEGTVSTRVSILVNGESVYAENIRLSSTSRTRVISTLLDANSVGIKNIRVSVASIENERNTTNNQRTTAIEVIDEKTNIAIISDLLHPDIGMLKKSIESNEQRAVSIKKPNTDLKGLEEIDLFILYQPTASFRAIYNYVQQKKLNTFTITGPKTDWDFLNAVQNSFTKNSYEQVEEVAPTLNTGFSIFNIADFDMEDFPPLEANLGDIIISKPHEVLVGQRIKGIDLDEPLLAVLGTDSEREAILFGENLWKWRMQSYRNQQDFSNFDELMGKLMLYLATNKPKARFTVDYETVYEGSNTAKLTATYFDEAFVFDANASINVQVRNKNSGQSKSLPMLLKGGYYVADLSDLPAGEFSFTAKVANENLSKSGSFTILDFDVEQQLLSSNFEKLGRLAENSSGTLYFPSQTNGLIQDLVTSERFVPIQKSEQNVVSLIDFRLVLGIIASALALEWFIRKYNGLI